MASVLLPRELSGAAIGLALPVTSRSSAYKRAPRNFVIIVTENDVSRDAYDFFCGAFGASMTSDDTVYIVTTAKSPDEEEEKQSFLAKFQVLPAKLGRTFGGARDP